MEKEKETKNCACKRACACGPTLPGLGDCEYKGNAALNAQKS